MPTKYEQYEKYLPEQRYEERRRAWLHVTGMEFVFLLEKNLADKGRLDAHLLVRHSKAKIGTMVCLSDLTMDELLAVREFIDIALANTAPTVEERDREADETYDQGDDANRRLYRAVPRILVREGEKYSDRPILLRGYEWPEKVSSYVARAARVVDRRRRNSSLPQ